ncbi:MAG TPA: sigma-54-dependent Fis family transcriptional regulator [Treponema sp.]|nr:sigma-54-dependent Fis family transcriptional regulator [Treponema sp.]
MRILIIDDEKNIRESIGKYLSLEGIDSAGAESGEAALEHLARETFDAVILDLKLPGMSGQTVLEEMQKQGILSPVIMISAHGEIADAVQALKSGARDYLVKPFDPAELSIRLRSLVENKRRENTLEAEARTDPRAVPLGETLLLGNSPAIRQLSSQINKIAASNVTVLITGESGTGKEVVAREIHRRSPDREEPFVAVNIGGIHEGLMESELFGHEKGSFTGAVNRKQGLFELAGRGCIFLDEIGEMPMPLQIKLLRVLQDRALRRLGGTADIPINARIISATNQNLETRIREGVFREDLYYRLNVFRINLPPLRERREDISLLAKHFLAKHAGRSKPVLTPGAILKLENYSFPGNVRELENIIERALIYCENQAIRDIDIDLHEHSENTEHAEKQIDKPNNEPAISAETSTLEEIEKQAIITALSRCDGNRTKAAEHLGVSRKTILNKIKQYDLK